MSEIQYPDTLPCVSFLNKTAQLVNPKATTRFISGRSRERRLYTSVPTTHNVRWVMTTEQAIEFEKWFCDVLLDGSEWFDMELHLPQGDGPWACRFIGVYAGPNKIASNLWEITATLEQQTTVEVYLTSTLYPLEQVADRLNIAPLEPVVKIETKVRYFEYQPETLDIAPLEPLVKINSSVRHLVYDDGLPETIDIAPLEPLVKIDTKVKYLTYDNAVPEALDIAPLEPVVKINVTAAYLSYNNYEPETLDIAPLEPVVRITTK